MIRRPKFWALLYLILALANFFIYLTPLASIPADVINVSGLLFVALLYNASKVKEVSLPFLVVNSIAALALTALALVRLALFIALIIKDPLWVTIL